MLKDFTLQNKTAFFSTDHQSQLQNPHLCRQAPFAHVQGHYDFPWKLVQNLPLTRYWTHRVSCYIATFLWSCRGQSVSQLLNSESLLVSGRFSHSCKRVRPPIWTHFHKHPNETILHVPRTRSWGIVGEWKRWEEEKQDENFRHWLSLKPDAGIIAQRAVHWWLASVLCLRIIRRNV